MSSEWSAGYVTDLNYTFGYYRELNPYLAQFALLCAGFASPDFANACELGFGQGVSIAIHAAGSETKWAGTDFNPSQALHAQGLARNAGVDADLCDQSFAEFCTRQDLPDFDFIGLHGIWSWISDENRAVIVDFIRRKLKVGGVVYMSYNSQPGWAAAAPLRHLMTELGANLASPGAGSAARVDGSLDFIDKIFATEPGYLRTNPQIKERFEGLKKQNRSYLAHEYFNRDWHPMYVADVARWLGPAKLTFAASANLLDSVDAINLSSGQQALLKEMSDPVLRETVRDYCVNQQFRRDLWIKGARRLTELEQSEAIRNQRLLLVLPRASVPTSVSGPLGSATLSEAIYKPLLDFMADHKVRNFREIEIGLKDSGLTFSQLTQAIAILTGIGAVAIAQDASLVPKAKMKTDRLNQSLMERARSSTDINFLVSPVTGIAVSVARFQQLFCMALKQGRKTPEEWAEFVFQLLNAQGQRLMKDGQVLENVDDNRAELLRQAQEFTAEQKPLLKALEIL
ncbi:methyltransferase regulatory domain-containing protein [Agrobacterium genomosp. 3]|uniref:class I SAM-dependent methyltransferase n=1 Tax=Agrobacterium tomkonis TaxID=1183410 RepID=UPI001CD8A106|nr:methyltransferase regulatory domain-containing protein [Agrobacterium tomkonis]MCA1879522.1 methyltransferase regulatory domain-containing protein [Agrobacterium tumefaciens]MCA1894740.1 methyltransferase regulatory domain-containing protein [Agrobacterium tomkonis]